MTAALSREQLDRVHLVAAVLLPGSSRSLPAVDLPDLDVLVQHAAIAVGDPDGTLAAAIAALPAEPTWDSLEAFAQTDRASFEQVALLAVGAYFMSPSVLASLGLPTGERRPADREQVVDELSSGVLDAVLERGCPVRTLDEVNERSSA